MADREQCSAVSAVRIIRRRLLCCLIARHALQLFIIAIFIWGLAVIACRMAFHVDGSAFLRGLFLLPLLLPIAFVSQRRRIPSVIEMAALLDSTNGLGGLFMAFSSGAEGNEWFRNGFPVRLPDVRWHAPVQWIRALAGCAFALVCLLVPVKSPAAGKASGMAVGDILNDLQARIEVLEEEKILSEDEIRPLTRTLQAVSEQASGEDPGKTWEALDHLAGRLAEEADREAEEAIRKAALFQRLETVSETAATLAKESDLGSEALTDVMQEMQSLLDSEGLESAIPEELMDALSSNELSAEQLSDFAKAMKLSKEELEKMLERLEGAGLVDADVLEKCRNGKSGEGEDGDEALAAFLADQGENAVTAMLCSMCRTPGNGGISRGRGDAEMTWTSGTSEENASFRAESIASDIPRNPGHSRLVGLSSSAPETNNEVIRVGSGALNDAHAGGGSARKQLLLPKHRGVVGTYFLRGGQEQ